MLDLITNCERILGEGREFQPDVSLELCSDCFVEPSLQQLPDGSYFAYCPLCGISTNPLSEPREVVVAWNRKQRLLRSARRP